MARGQDVCLTAYALLCREIMTLYDLEQQLCLALSVSEFSQLQLGPLLRNPVIIQHFKPPQDRVVIPKVLTSANKPARGQL